MFNSVYFFQPLFVVILSGTFLLACVMRKKDRAKRYTQHAPTLLTTVGLLGTIVGIAAALQGFDVGSIGASIEGELEGVKEQLGSTWAIMTVFAQGLDTLDTPNADVIMDGIKNLHDGITASFTACLVGMSLSVLYMIADSLGFLSPSDEVEDNK